MFIYVAASVLLCAGMASALMPREAGAHPVRWVGFDGYSVIAIFLIYVGCHAFFGSTFAIALLIALGLHEAGHVLAHRMLGRGTSHFRLVPLLSEVPVQADPFRDEGQAFFVALMGAGFSLAPMVLSLALAAGMASSMPDVASFLLVLGTTIGAVNFIMLLPFQPLDGGRCAVIAARNFWPALAPGITAFMIAAFFSAGFAQGSLGFFVLGAFGLASLFARPVANLKPMGPNAALIGLAAYAFTLSAHFSSAWLLFGLMI